MTLLKMDLSCLRDRWSRRGGHPGVRRAHSAARRGPLGAVVARPAPAIPKGVLSSRNHVRRRGLRWNRRNRTGLQLLAVKFGAERKDGGPDLSQLEPLGSVADGCRRLWRGGLTVLNWAASPWDPRFDATLLSLDERKMEVERHRPDQPEGGLHAGKAYGQAATCGGGSWPERRGWTVQLSSRTPRLRGSELGARAATGRGSHHLRHALWSRVAGAPKPSPRLLSAWRVDWHRRNKGSQGRFRSPAGTPQIRLDLQ